MATRGTSDPVALEASLETQNLLLAKSLAKMLGKLSGGRSFGTEIFICVFYLFISDRVHYKWDLIVFFIEDNYRKQCLP